MPVRIPDKGTSERAEVADPVLDLLETLEKEFPHEHCLFTAGGSFNIDGPFTPYTTIWMFYPGDREYYPEDSTFLATLTDIVEDVEPSTYSHVSYEGEYDFPDDAPDEVTKITKINPKSC